MELTNGETIGVQVLRLEAKLDLLINLVMNHIGEEEISKMNFAEDELKTMECVKEYAAKKYYDVFFKFMK